MRNDHRMYRRVLVATDFSDASISAAKWASQFFASDAELTLVHAVELPHRPPFARASLPPEDAIKTAVVDFATTRLNEIAHFLSPAKIRSDIRRGHPADVVRQVVAETQADLVVIGPHGDRPRRAQFLGSSADRIVRTSPVSVLVGTEPRHHVPRQLLVPVDDADATRSVLARVRDLSASWNAHVTLLHVWSNALYSYVASISHAQASDEATAKRDIAEEIDNEAARWLRALAGAGIPDERVSVVVTHGNAGDETLALAEQLHPDVIVLGRRGSGLVAPAVMGSTVGKVLHGARCPVLVVADEHPEPAAKM
jgi:nucleotide-binding universal stress UspA family protein